MYAGTSKRLASKTICSPCLFRASCRALSTTPGQAARRDRVPRHVLKAQDSHSSRKGTTPEDKDKLPRFYIPIDLANGLAELGLTTTEPVVEVLRKMAKEASKMASGPTITALATQQRFVDISSNLLGTAEGALLRDVKVLGKAFHLLGVAHFHRQNKRTAFDGVGTLRLAFLGGEDAAAVDAAAADQLLSTHKSGLKPWIQDASLLARIKAKAHAGDWRAMCIYIAETTRRAERKETLQDCYKLAMKLWSLVQPSKQQQSDLQYDIYDYAPPSFYVGRAARRYLEYLPADPERDQVQANYEKALREGINQYSYPRDIPYALREPKVIARHSDEWVDLAEKAAAAGEGRAAFDLAMYHLGKGNWRPKSSQKPTDWTGIEWLAVSAALSVDSSHVTMTSPDDMASKYLGLAHLLREHGYEDEGYYWMGYAKENLAEAGLDPDQAYEKYLEDFEKSWKAHAEDHTLRMKESEEFFANYLWELDKLPTEAKKK